MTEPYQFHYQIRKDYTLYNEGGNKRMITVNYWDSQKVTLFAVEELKRLLAQVKEKTTLTYQDNHRTNEKTIHLVTKEKYESLHENQITMKDDSFTIVSANDHTWIIGNEARAILYGVYTYCQKVYGFSYAQLGKEVQVNGLKQSLPNVYTHKPRFTRRGNVVETINDPQYIEQLIDFGVKNGLNEFFFTFFLWDEIGPYLVHALERRDVLVTLGGHSLSFLIDEVAQDDTEGSLTQKDKLRFFSGNEKLQALVIDKIIAICKQNTVVGRISLWPEDIGIDKKDADNFISSYIQFTEKLQEAIKGENLSVEVEHIVYNAGLSWDMLERNETEASKKLDVLYAYWGRDYARNINDKATDQERAKSALDDWTTVVHQQSKDITVFEYYSDHFMLTELFPPLIKRIGEDVIDYEEMGIDGMVNLLVPLHKKNIDKTIDENYPWRWTHLLNNFIFAKMAWGSTYEEAIKEYFAIFEQDASAYKEKINLLEEIIAEHTQWNRLLFPARIVDAEKVSTLDSAESPHPYLAKIKAELDVLDLSHVEQLLPIQNDKNSSSFTIEEMTDIYIYYIKRIVALNEKAWRGK